jgi:CRISPR-associated protein (TIGR03984 family)
VDSAELSTERGTAVRHWERQPGESWQWAGPEDVKVDLQDVAEQVAGNSPAWVLVYTDYAVAWGRAEKRRCEMDPALAPDLIHPDFILQLRIFGLFGEWHAWRDGDIFQGRLRLDEEVAASDVIDEHQALWGTRKPPGEPSPGWTVLTEERGPVLRVPHTGISASDKDRLRLQVRHYLKVEPETHLTTITDSRLVALCAGSPPKPLPFPD